jgi:branched-chain amino acid transport system substrate-binding protein
MNNRIGTSLATTALAALLSGPALAAGTYDSGATDTSIKIGNTWPYSGAGSGSVPGVRGLAALFKSLNDKGGINGRKIDFDSVDDGYLPPKTVEQTRKLVEEDSVLFIFASLGTPTGEAVAPYLNSHKIPQLFLITGGSALADPAKYPWSMVGIASYAAEGRVFAQYLLKEKPDAKVALLYQDDDFGRDHLDAFVQTLGPNAAKMVVAKASYQFTDPTLNSQMISLKSSGADTIYLITQGRAAPQAVSAIRSLDWHPLVLLSQVSTTKGIIGPAGNEALKGVISAGIEKDPSTPENANDPAVKEYLAWMQKYVPQTDWETDRYSPAFYDLGLVMAEVLRRSGDDLTRANVMKQATHLDRVTLPLLLPGVNVSTSPTNYFPFRTMVMERFDGERWVPFGPPLSG